MTDELKPCPFCGGGGLLERRAGGWVARCWARFIDCEINGRTHHFARGDEANTAWNTRAPDPRIAELEAEVAAAYNAAIEDAAMMMDGFGSDLTADLIRALAKP